MNTVRPLNPEGAWRYKTEKEYLCVRDGEERGSTSAEFKAAQADGWEKQYRAGRKKGYLSPSRSDDYERLSKTPRSTRFRTKKRGIANALNYTVTQYCVNQIRKGKVPEEVAMYKAMLNCGAAA